MHIIHNCTVPPATSLAVGQKSTGVVKLLSFERVLSRYFQGGYPEMFMVRCL